MERRYRRLLEHFGATARACRFFLVFLVTFYAGYALLMMASGTIGHSRLWFLPLITTPIVLVLMLVFFGRRACR